MPKLRVARLTWSDFTAVVQVKTFYISLVIIVVGVALLAFSVATEGLVATLLVALGVTLVTSSVFSLIGETMVRTDVVEFVHGEIDALRREIRHSAPARGSDPTVQLHVSRRNVDWTEFLTTATGTLRVSGLSSNDILAATSMDRLFDAVVDRRLARVEVLLLDPESATGAVRAAQPAYRRAATLGDKLRSVIAELDDLDSRLSEAGLPDRVRSALVGEPVTVSMVADDHRVFVTPIVRTLTGGASPTFVFTSSGAGQAYYEVYLSHFASLGRMAGWS